MRVKIFRWKAIGAALLFLAIVGVLVWLFRDARRDSWHLHGWWD